MFPIFIDPISQNGDVQEVKKEEVDHATRTGFSSLDYFDMKKKKIFQIKYYQQI